jgi:hypothetical protein
MVTFGRLTMRWSSKTDVPPPGCGGFQDICISGGYAGLRPLQQFRQLGDVSSDAPRLVTAQQISSGAPAGLAFEIDVGQYLAVVVAQTKHASVSSVIHGGDSLLEVA